jgi:hypothetical protein
MTSSVRSHDTEIKQPACGRQVRHAVAASLTESRHDISHASYLNAMQQSADFGGVSVNRLGANACCDRERRNDACSVSDDKPPVFLFKYHHSDDVC